MVNKDDQTKKKKKNCEIEPQMQEVSFKGPIIKPRKRLETYCENDDFIKAAPFHFAFTFYEPAI